jgi:predicted Zn-dependent protease
LRKKVVASEIVAVAASWTPVGGWYAAIGANFSQFAMVTMVYGYSRQLEAEADRNAVDRVRQAGRDPMQLIRTFAIMEQKLEPEPVPYLLRDHPKTKDRIDDLKRILGVNQDAAPGSDSGYLNRMRPVILQNIQLDLDSRRFRSAVSAAERLAAA